jgi:hypothetical protein
VHFLKRNRNDDELAGEVGASRRTVLLTSLLRDDGFASSIQQN